MGIDQDVIRIRFGGFELQPGERRLLQDGQPMAVGPRAYNLLVALVRAGGPARFEDELLDLVWPNLGRRREQPAGSRLGPKKDPRRGTIATVRATATVHVDAGPRGAPAPAATAEDNLPRQITSFVGRERELAEVKELLDARRGC